LTDEKYHNIGIDWDTSRIDVGRYGVTGEAKDIGAFRTPTLREIALTAPYMHDGRFSTLRQVVDYYLFRASSVVGELPCLERWHRSPLPTM
jgi:cytochrome c peroxidase